MYQKMDLQQLQTLSLDEVKAYKKKAEARKAELEALKAKGGTSWAEELQDELNEVALFLVDVDDVIEEKEATKKTVKGKKQAEAKEAAYTPKPGTESMVHVRLVHGRRFNPFTGKEESAPFIQLFTFSEWQLFKKNFRGLGYTVMEALHDPYGDAADLVIKK